MIIDLSVPLNEKTPVYPGDPATKIELAGVLDKDGYRDHFVSFGTHVGTHIDAPMHMLKDGISLNQIPIDNFIGRGRIVVVSEGNFEAVENLGIQADDIVLFHTGMSDKYYEPVYFDDYPAMTEETAKYLVEAGVKMVGVDTCSVDNQDGFPIHKILLSGNVLIIENLTNLSGLVGKEFTIHALPINLQIDGAPARVVAETK